ncbi:MAG: hypothetical protein MAG795_00297 [Candidatus Woesearchaeota archaeon]|nr:hypothetical protein [Candidatus Woesearchaeota archaeon]
MQIIAVVGMCGCGKSLAAEIFKEQGYEYVRFGQAVIDEVMRRGLKVNEKNERNVRESMRKEHGMAAMAKFLIPIFDKLLEENNVVADGLYSWEEYLLLKEKYQDQLIILGIYASPKTRYKRLANRILKKNDKKAINRPTTPKQSESRDYSEIENLNKAGPIAMADYLVVNEGTEKQLKQKVLNLIEKLSE